jgi:hypothetical protein
MVPKSKNSETPVATVLVSGSLNTTGVIDSNKP